MIVFYWALFFDSFKTAVNPDGTIMVNPYTGEPLIRINIQVFIAPIILCYEMLLLALEGKKRGRYVPWFFYYRLFRYNVYLKLLEGKQLTKEYFDNKKNSFK